MTKKPAGIDEGTLNRRFTAASWALFLAMWVATLLVERFAQIDLRNLQYVCVGVILLGLNLARFNSSIPMSRLTVVVGFLSLFSGLVRQFYGNLDVIPAVAITAASLLLAYAAMTLQARAMAPRGRARF